MNTELYIYEFEEMLASIDVDDIYLNQLFNIYHQRLITNTVACKKVERRGLRLEAISLYNIGFCDRKLNRYIKPSEKPDGAGFRGTLQRLNLINFNGHEIFRGCIVEPVYEDSKLVAACGIKLICPSRPAPRIIQWFRDRIYTSPVEFKIMSWGQRYVTR